MNFLLNHFIILDKKLTLFLPSPPNRKSLPALEPNIDDDSWQSIVKKKTLGFLGFFWITL